MSTALSDMVVNAYGGIGIFSNALALVSRVDLMSLLS